MSLGVGCRACGAAELSPFLSLGETPVANALVSPELGDGVDPVYPLTLAFCERCTLVQLMERLPAEEIFSRGYPYFSSYSDELLNHAKLHATTLMEQRSLGPESLVVEVASNDGYLLRNFVEAGVPVLGIDPAPGPAKAAIDAGVTTLVEFFGESLARRLRNEGQRADVLIANNVMAHVPDLNGFVAGLRTLIADDGLITIENPYVRDLVEHREFDTIYHEHHCYFSCTAVDHLVRQHGLYLNDVEYFPGLHGGTLRWHVSPQEAVSARTRAYLTAERDSGMAEFAYYRNFGSAVEHNREELRRLIRGLRAEGKSVAAYGAAAKGSTLLNYAGLGTESIYFVVDRNPHKQGLLMPGVHNPIRPVEALLSERPDYVLMLAWNFKDEVMRQQAEYATQGGQFIIPVPRPRVVTCPVA
jgi:SAM-dependent methyltransferase